MWRRSASFQGKVAWGWRFFSFGLLSWSVGQLYFAVLDNFTSISPYPSFADVGYFGLALCFAVGLWLVGEIGKGQRGDVRFTLDAVMISLATGLLYWNLILRASPHPFEYQPWIALAYPLGDLILLMMAVLIALWSPHSPVARRFPLLGIGLVLFLVADAIYQTQAGTFQYSASGPLNVLWTLGAVSIGCWAYFSRPSASQDTMPDIPRWSELAEAALTLLPSFGFMVSLWLLMTTQGLLAHTSKAVQGAALCALLLISLGLVRQVLSLRMELGLRRKLQGQASLDTLTGVFNRRQITERLAGVIRKATQHGTSSAVLFIDLDRFKRINDAFGHRTGDEVLTEAARRIGRCIRDHDSIARMGGDEFVVILSRIRDAQEAGLVAQRILHAVSRPIVLNDQSFALTASIGIAVSPDDGQVGEALVHHADLAMYQVKKGSRNGYQFYSETLKVDVQPQLKIEAQLLGALERGEFQLHYQPLVELKSGRIHSLECLLRWVSPVLGAVPPGTFVPLAEERGLIVEMGSWVLRQAAEHVSTWREAGHSQLCVSVNISPVQFEQPDFVALVDSILVEYRLPGQALLLELTEGSLIKDLSASNVKLAQLRARGIRIGLDDFGTGFSSLSYLRQLQVDILKIDRSFINAMEAEGSAFVHMIVQLAQHLRLTTVAEGIETHSQRAILTALNCEIGQGYLFCRPQPAEAIPFLLRSHQHVRVPEAIGS
ncbi:EAL domain-containing protein (plasmid) [Deinococcus sp. KNUC1210]|uniref:putative bifunctional diguanylate cyclase/phosphodiesterase n=1 Tax=Deinococcus sp. KNUC1210 TaxID=2917691 RepID=UPI001EF15D9C|nr:EAL domain-containing protein [Deinococcus sp. KNUC1210]ULH13856.1 EAL domain-containing protein [Deinococcus sp. KNUC1210]